MTKSSIKLRISVITHEGDVFIHKSIGTYFTAEGAKKDFILEQGKDWLDGKTLDDLLK